MPKKNYLLKSVSIGTGPYLLGSRYQNVQKE